MRRPVDVLIHRVDPDVPIPAYGHPGDAGADLVTTEAVELAPGERAVLPTGVSIALPDGYAAFVHPRSGLAARCGVALVNAPGTVDAGYRGEIKVIVINLDPREPVRFERFDRIAQLVVQQVEKVSFHEVAELPGSARGEEASDPPEGMLPVMLTASGAGSPRAGTATLRSYPTGKDSDVFGRRKKSGSAEDVADEAREAEQVVDELDDADGAGSGTRRVNLPLGAPAGRAVGRLRGLPARRGPGRPGRRLRARCRGHGAARRGGR